ncbi:MAG: ABC transporter ATP-binding protein [Verrucomicrobia bacterium]|nr:ABC transporter ATP-binding protein [Verrucomicrobiota bacterium]
MPPAITVKNLSKTFRLPEERRGTLRERLMKFGVRNERKAKGTLDDISFEIQQGEFFGIIGRNGSGKSTLLKILAGIYKPDKGSEFTIHGRIAPMLELGVGFNAELTGRENVYLSATILGLKKSEIDARYEEIVRFAELENFMELQVKHYSSGMSVKLGFAIATQVDAPIMLLDEVLAVGDFVFQEKCFALFEQYKKEGKTIILVTHDPGAMERFADRAILIHESKLEMIGDPQEVLEKYHALG